MRASVSFRTVPNCNPADSGMQVRLTFDIGHGKSVTEAQEVADILDKIQETVGHIHGIEPVNYILRLPGVKNQKKRK